MASLIAKWQKCGKKGCRCVEGFLHGPYFWYLQYISKKIRNGRSGKYKWTYLGRNPQNVWKKLQTIDTRFNERYKLSDLNEKMKALIATKIKNNNKKSSEEILSVKEDFLRD